MTYSLTKLKNCFVHVLLFLQLPFSQNAACPKTHLLFSIPEKRQKRIVMYITLLYITI